MKKKSKTKIEAALVFKARHLNQSRGRKQTMLLIPKPPRKSFHLKTLFASVWGLAQR